MSEYDDIWGAPDVTGSQPGIYLGEVMFAERKTTDDGKPYWNLRFVKPGTETVLCFDKLFMAGKPTALSLTKRRLKALGFLEGSKPTADDFRGRRVWIALIKGKARDNGKRFLEVDV